MTQHIETAWTDSLARFPMPMLTTRRMRRLAHAFGWLLVTSACLAACGLDPVATTDKCKGAGPFSENCPQCQTPPFAAECGQCRQSGADPELCGLPGGGAGEDARGGSGDVGASGQRAAAGTPTGGVYAAGAGGDAMAGEMAGTGATGPTCSGNADCHAPTPACHAGTHTCVACIDDTQCSGGQVCDTLKNRCTDCLRDDDCGKCPGGGSACRPKDDGTCSSEYRCVDCEGNRGCTKEKPVCVEQSCVECATDGDCGAGPSGAKRHCTAEHRCVGCSSKADCAVPTPVCDTAGTHTCLGCLSAPDCAAPTPVCDAAGSHACVGCLSRTDCAAPTPVCDTAGSHTCLGCLSNADCSAPTGLCDTAGTHTCVACLSKADCSGATPLCDAAGTRTCVGCLSKSDCGGTTPACAMDGHECVECQAAEDCPKVEAASCLVRNCGACTADDDCKHLADTPFCSTGQWRGTCIQCRSDADCGAGTCDLTAFRCSATRPHTVADCLPCGNDSQCFAGSACVSHQASKYPGTFCFPLMQGATCGRPLSNPVHGMPTINRAEVDVCLKPVNVSCKAIRASLDRLPCAAEATCGESETDGTCRNLQCTYYCKVDEDCRTGLSCNVWCQ